MPVRVSFADDQVFLHFDGNLDVSVSRDVFRICARVTAGLRSCVIDLTDTARLFDSGLALLQVLHRRLVDNGTTVTIRGTRPEIRERVAAALKQDVRTRMPASGAPGKTARFA